MWQKIAPIPTGIFCFLAVSTVALSLASAGQTNQKDKDAVVREIDLKGFARARTSAVAAKPTRITNAEELAKAFPDVDATWLVRIAKQVDFDKEELLFFAWTGSNTDRLSFKVDESRKVPVVAFNFARGSGEDMPRAKFRLYAIAKNWRIDSTK
jgi:hypothetical protein